MSGAKEGTASGQKNASDFRGIQNGTIRGGDVGTDWTFNDSRICLIGLSNSRNDYFFAARGAAAALAAGGVNWLTALFRFASSASTACLVVLVSCS